MMPFKTGVEKTPSQIKAKVEVKIVEKINPPTNPSQVFFGEITGAILCLPNKTPVK